MKNNELRDILESAAGASGLDFYGMEMVPAGRGETIVRVYIQSKTGVTVDDCAKVSRQAMATLTASGLVDAMRYKLEVSSPGMERRLLERAHFEGACGETVSVKMDSAIDNRKNFVGILKAVDVNDITLTLDEGEVTLPFANIAKAHIVAQW